MDAMTIENYTGMIESGCPFSVANYGDGEWRWILGERLTNCDGVHGSEELTDALKLTLDHGGDYYYGTTHRRGLSDVVQTIIDQKYSHLKWVDKEVFANANINGKLRPFFDACDKKCICYVGPYCNMKALDNLFLQNVAMIAIPPTVAFDKRNNIIHRVFGVLSICDILLISAGPLTNHLIWLFDRLAKECQTTMIDMGACFDPYAGVFSRKGYRDPAKREKMKANLLPGVEIEGF